MKISKVVRNSVMGQAVKVCIDNEESIKKEIKKIIKKEEKKALKSGKV